MSGTSRLAKLSDGCSLLLVLTLVLAACGPSPAPEGTPKPVVEAEVTEEEPAVEVVKEVEAEPSVGMKLFLSTVRAYEETWPKAGEDEILVVAAMLDASLVLEAPAADFILCTLEHPDAEGLDSVLKCLDNFTAEYRVDHHWIRSTPVYGMETGDSERIDMLLSPEVESDPWHSLGRHLQETTAQTITVTVPLHVVTALIFELDNGPDAVVNAIEDEIEHMIEILNEDADEQNGGGAEGLDDTIRDEIDNLEDKIVMEGMGWGSNLGPAGLFLGWAIGEMVAGVAPEYIGHNTITFTPLGYLANYDLEDLLNAGSKAQSRIFACQWMPAQHYRSNILLGGYTGADGHYALGFTLRYSLDRIPDPQKIEISEVGVVFDRNHRGPYPVTINNIGTATLALCGMSAGSPFTLDAASCSGSPRFLAPGESCQVKIGFRPPRWYDFVERMFLVRTNDSDIGVIGIDLLAFERAPGSTGAITATAPDESLEPSPEASPYPTPRPHCPPGQHCCGDIDPATDMCTECRPIDSNCRLK